MLDKMSHGGEVLDEVSQGDEVEDVLKPHSGTLNSLMTILLSQMRKPTSLEYTWPGCNFIELPPEKCQVRNCCNYLHHMCQTDWLWKNNIEETALKKSVTLVA